MKRGLVLGGLIVVALCAVSGEPSYAKQGRVVQTLPKPKPKPQAQPPSPPQPPEPPRPSPIVNPDWTDRPRADDLLRYYPERAKRLEREGRATINCLVNAAGTLEACSVVSEDPPDMGFGDATIRASRLFKMRPQTKDGKPVDGGTVRLPLVWKLPQ